MQSSRMHVAKIHLRTAISLLLLLLLGWTNQSFSSTAPLGCYWKDNTLPYDTEFSYFFDVAAYPEGIFEDNRAHSFAYVTAQNKHVTYGGVAYSVEAVLQYGYNANNRNSIKRLWVHYYQDPARFIQPWIDSDADGVDYWDLSTLDAKGYLAIQSDGYGDHLKFLRIQEQTLFIAETTSPVRSTWQIRFYFFNFKKNRWDKKMQNTFVLPASREAVRNSTLATGGGIWAGILEVEGLPTGLDKGYPPVKNIVYKNRYAKVVDHGITRMVSLDKSNNNWIDPNSNYQVLYLSPGDYTEFVAGYNNVTPRVQSSGLTGGRVKWSKSLPFSKAQ